MNPLRILFMGSPQMAVPSLEALEKSGEEIVGVITQPDRPAGRGKNITPCAVAQFAKEKNFPLFQPEKIRNADFLNQLKELSPDLIVVVAYGKILPKEILELPPQKCINVHFSLLPEYRGAAPVQWALINGEEETGVSTMFIEEELDAGPVLLQEEIAVNKEDNTETLSARLAPIGAKLLLKTIEKLKKGELIPIPQDEDEATFAPSLKKSDGQIDFSKKANLLWHRIRGVTPWPGAFTHLDGKILKIHKAALSNGKGRPGEILKADSNGIEVACGTGSLLIQELQLEGKNRLTAADFLKGHSLEVGSKLG